MYNFISTFEQEWDGILSPFHCAMLSATHELVGFDCFYSTLDEIDSGKHYSLYELPFLMRILLKKEQIISDDLEAILYEKDENIICRVLEWDVHVKKILLVQVDPHNHFSSKLFTDKMRDSEMLLSHFDNIYDDQRSDF